MPKVERTQRVLKDLDALSRSNRGMYRNARIAIGSLEDGHEVPFQRRHESRIPDAYKYDLKGDSGYRIVFQMARDGEFICLVAGKHDEVEAFLDQNKGKRWNSNGLPIKVSEPGPLKKAPHKEPARTPHPLTQSPAPPKRKTFRKFKKSELVGLRVPSNLIQRLLKIKDFDALEFLNLLEQVEHISQSMADQLLSIATSGSIAAKRVIPTGKKSSSRPFLKPGSAPLARLAQPPQKPVQKEDSTDRIERFYQREKLQIKGLRTTVVGRSFRPWDGKELLYDYLDRLGYKLKDKRPDGNLWIEDSGDNLKAVVEHLKTKGVRFGHGLSTKALKGKRGYYTEDDR